MGYSAAELTTDDPALIRHICGSDFGLIHQAVVIVIIAVYFAIIDDLGDEPEPRYYGFDLENTGFGWRFRSRRSQHVVRGQSSR